MTWNGGNNSRQKGSEFWQLKQEDPNEQNRIIEGLDLDTDLNDMAESIDKCLNKDGQNALTGNLNFGNHKAINYGSSTPSKSGSIAERINTRNVQLELFDDEGSYTDETKFAEREGFYQVVGDIVYYSLYFKFAANPPAYNDDPTVWIPSPESVYSVGDGAANLMYPVEVITSANSEVKRGRFITNESLGDGTKTFGIKLSDWNGLGLSQWQPVQNEEIWLSGWYKINDESFVL